MPATEKLHQHTAPKPELVEFLDLDPEMTRTRPAHGGHMAYNRYFIADSTNEFFVKAHDASKFTDKKREANSRQYLDKEAVYMKHIQEVAGKAVPQVHGVVEGALVLESLSEESGWHWRAPQDEDQRAQYIEDILGVFKSIESAPVIRQKLIDSHPALDVFLKDGWQALAEKKPKLLKKASDWRSQLSSENQRYFARLINDMMFVEPSAVAMNLSKLNKKSVLSHHDARQANIAWHPEQGVRVVDWSWADPGTEGADSTMFLIDLAKSGHDVTQYMDMHFDDDHAMLLLGYYLSRCLDDASEGNEQVRFHQFASAVTTYRLLVEKTP